MAESKTHCVLPWTHLAVKPSGTVSACCRFGEELEASAGQDLKAMMSHPRMEALRERIARGERDPGCSKCYAEEEAGEVSYRQSKNREVAPPAGGRPTLTYLEIALGNKCNLRCRGCSSVNSTAWISEEKAMGVPSQYIAGEYRFDPAQLERVAGTLTHIKFLGGEPLLTKEHLQCLQMLDRLGRLPYLQLEYSTNCTIRPQPEVLRLWSRAATLLIAFSIDGLREKNDRFRRGSRWQNVIANVHWFLANVRAAKTLFLVHTVVSADNVADIPEIDRWLGAEFPRIVLFKRILDAPDWLAVRNMSPAAKASALAAFEGAPPRPHYESIKMALQEPALIPFESYLEETAKIDALDA